MDFLRRMVGLSPIFILLFTIAGCSERSTSRFSDYAELQKSDISDRGWVPEWLHNDAANITETHDLDTNQVLIFYQSKLAQNSGAPAICKAADSRLLEDEVELLDHKIDTRNAQDCDGFFMTIKNQDVMIWKPALQL